MNYDNYEFIKIAGKGSFGTVLLARNLESNRKVAIKRIHVGKLNKLETVREISALRCLHHVNILKYVGCFGVNETISIVTEHVGFTLQDIIADKLKPKSEDFLRWIAFQTIEGVHYMHKSGIMHRDLKPDNILITSEKIIKIADFGQACIIEEDGTDYDVNVATRWYRAPELLFSQTKYTESIDVWAMGCIFAELSRGKPLFPGRTELEQISQIFSVLGTPSEDTWPGFDEMPDSSKLSFHEKLPMKDWRKIYFIQIQLRLNGNLRCSSQTIRDHRWMKEKVIKAPHSYCVRKRKKPTKTDFFRF